MAVTSLEFADKERYLSEIDKLVHSQTLRKSESLCKLLRYLAEQAIIHPGGAGPKEYQIATEVFGRPPDFDPQADSAIRVQAGRLRLKLLEYYRSEGTSDPIIVEIPNGSYALTFHAREPLIAVPAAPVAVTRRLVDRRAPRRNVRGWMIAVAVLSFGLVAAVAALVNLSVSLNSARAQKQTVLTAAPGALHAFWHQFTSGPDAPWVIFSNAAFVGRPETGMRYLDPAHDSRDLILDHYTGVGEVLAVHELDEVFRLLDHPIRVKRGSLFSLDDAKDNDLIFVGSPAENLSLLDLPGTQEFVFKRFDSSQRKDLGIVNTHPEPGEPAAFYPSGATRQLVEDYAIVALVRGLNPERRVLILAGTTTIGTQAAVEYVCGKDSLEELVRRLNALSVADGKPFEALLRVKVTRGVPVGTQLVAIRKRK